MSDHANYLAPPSSPRLARPLGSLLLVVVFVGIVLTVVLAPSTLKAQSQPAAVPSSGYGFAFALPTVPVQGKFAILVPPKPISHSSSDSRTVWLLLGLGGAVVLAGGATLGIRRRNSRFGV